MRQKMPYMPLNFTSISHFGSGVSQLSIMTQTRLPKFLLRKDVKSKDGRQSILFQIIINSKKKTYTLPIKVFASQWDANNQQVKFEKSRRQEEISINLHLSNMKTKANNIYQRFMVMGKTLSLENFIKEFENPDPVTNFVTYFFKSIETSNIKETSKIAYRSVAKRVQEYNPNLMFADINAEFIRLFANWVQKKYKIDTNTLKKYEKTIQTYVTMAIKEEVAYIANPYENHKKKSKKVFKKSLSVEEVNKLIGFYNSDVPTTVQKEVLSAFIFSCIAGGYRFSELIALTDENIVNDEIIFEATKTNTTMGFRRIKLTTVPMRIVEGRKGTLFNFPTKKSNAHNEIMKAIGEYLEIKTRITFHVARHTFATHYLLNGGKVEHLKHILGHGKMDTTMVYVHVVDEMVNQRMHIMDRYKEIK